MVTSCHNIILKKTHTEYSNFPKNLKIIFIDLILKILGEIKSNIFTVHLLLKLVIYMWVAFEKFYQWKFYKGNIITCKETIKTIGIHPKCGCFCVKRNRMFQL